MYKIGIFDSGVGGLTVLKEIQALNKKLEIIYYADTKNSPYGDKTLKEVQIFCKNIVQFFIDNHVDLIVIACNTATIASIDLLKTLTNIPIIGVINPGVANAVNVTKNNKIGVLATPLTVKLNAYKNEISILNKNINVFQKGCKELCPMIENGWETFSNRKDILKSYIDELPSDIDTLILGCTHYPLITKDIKEIFNGIIINPAKNTSIQVNEQLNLIRTSPFYSKERTDFFISGEIKEFKSIAEQFLNEKISTIFRLHF